MDPHQAPISPSARTRPPVARHPARLPALLLATLCLAATAHAAAPAPAPVQLRPARPRPTADDLPPPDYLTEDPRDKRAAGHAVDDFEKLHKRPDKPLEVWRALADLGHFDVPVIADVALDELECKQLEHRPVARRLIAGLQSVDSLERVLDKGLDARQPEVRAQVLLALADGCPVALDWITPTAAALDDKEAMVRAAAVEALGLAQAQGRVDRILALAEDESVRVRQQVPAALVRLVQARALPMLRTLSEDPSWRVRSAVVSAFGQLKSQAASEELVTLLAREAGRVQEDAHRELVALTHADFGAEAEDWRRFLQSHPAATATPEPTPARGPSAAGTTVIPITESTWFDVPVLSRRLVLVIDISGSMEWSAQLPGADSPDAPPLSRLDVTKRELQHLLLGFGPEVSLDLVWFGDGAKSWKQRLMPMKATYRATASKELDGLHPSGGTNLRDALSVCFDMAEDSLDDVSLEGESPDTLYVLTDGEPNTPTEVLLDYVAERNRELALRMHCVCLSTDEPATEFMRALAELTQGEYANPLE